MVHTFNLVFDEDFRLEPSCDVNYWISLDRNYTVSKLESQLPGFTQFQRDMTKALLNSILSIHSKIKDGHIYVRPVDITVFKVLIEDLCKK